MDWLNTLHEVIGSDDGSLTWWQMTTRAGLIFFVGLALIRLFGQRALGRQTVLDVILAIVIGSNLSRAATGNAPFVPTITATTGLVLLYWTLDQLAARWHLASWLVKGGVVQLVRDGKMDRKTMQRTGISEGDIEEAMRRNGIGELNRIKRAYLERNGKISVLAD